jgi:hypothetical protein
MFSFGEDNTTLCGDLTYKTRIIGFLACSITGWVLSLIMTFVFIFSEFSVAAYAVTYSIGQILNIAGSCFLSTPEGQIKAMKKKHRLIPSVFYIGLIILTLVIAIATEIKGLVLFLVVLQVFAYYWYTISFIPFGNKILKKLCSSCFDMGK